MPVLLSEYPADVLSCTLGGKYNATESVILVVVGNTDDKPLALFCLFLCSFAISLFLSVFIL